MCLRPHETDSSLSLSLCMCVCVCVCVCMCMCEGDEWLSESIRDDKICINKNTPEEMRSIHIYDNTETVTFDLEIGRRRQWEKEKGETQRETEGL